MSLQEIEAAIAELPPAELDTLREWMDERQADAWDRQIEQDARAGRLDTLVARAKQQVKDGQYQPVLPDSPLAP